MPQAFGLACSSPMGKTSTSPSVMKLSRSHFLHHLTRRSSSLQRRNPSTRSAECRHLGRVLLPGTPKLGDALRVCTRHVLVCRAATVMRFSPDIPDTCGRLLEPVCKTICNSRGSKQYQTYLLNGNIIFFWSFGGVMSVKADSAGCNVCTDNLVLNLPLLRVCNIKMLACRRRPTVGPGRQGPVVMQPTVR